MVKFKAFVEDEYGPQFFEKLVDLLKRKDFISKKVSVDFDRLPADCNRKIDRAIRAALTFGYDRVILIVDGDGNPEDRKRRVESHVPLGHEDRVDVIVFEHEAEDWICISLGIKLSSYLKPSKALNDWLRRKEGKEYHKRDLPKFVRRLDLNKLKADKTFRIFVEILSKE